MQIGRSREAYEDCQEGDYVMVAAVIRNGLTARPSDFTLRLIPCDDGEHLVWLRKSRSWDVDHLPLRSPFFRVSADFDSLANEWVPADPEAWKTAG